MLLATLVTVSLNAFAEGDQPKHLIAVTTDGLGWSGFGNKFDWDKDKSGVRDSDYSNGKLALNYGYIFESKVMVGAELNYEYEKSETEYDTGDKESEETTTSSLALFIGYNFNEDLFNSWWVKASLGAGSIETESKDTTATPQETDSDIGVSFITIEAGKRFSFEGLGLKNLTFSPSIAFTSASYDEDADDAGLNESTAATLNIIKFDILF